MNRWLSGLAAALFALVIIWLGGWWFTLSLGVIVHLALLEFFRLAQFKGIRPATKTTLVVCQLLLITTQLFPGSALAAAILPLAGTVICGWLLLQPITGSIADIAASIFGLFYLGFLPSHWVRLRASSDGLAITLFAFVLIWAADCGSYLWGSRYGRTMLSEVSPNKTVEGALAGLTACLICGACGGVLLGWQWGWAVGAVLGALVALFALVGDLTESMMKRDAGVKDSGALIPGHGGILDRVDSYLFTPAVVFYFVTLIQPLLR
ncbi:phosphatidate cytidylyltransferase [Synechococcus sp. UW140]|uniref:phosphatidate cytidylyltransferase n=1 Tax=Synechococcus sp. UW140 TaxID=368503 RepID=UPI003137DF66